MPNEVALKSQNVREKRAQKKQELIDKKQYALDSTLWTGDNVIVSNAIQYGVQNLQINAKRVVYLGLSKIETKRAGEAELTRRGWGTNLYAKDFALTFNIHESNVYELMKLGVDQLLKKIVEFEYIDSTTQKMVYRAIPWVSSAEYIKEEGEITLVFNDNLTPYITRMAAGFGGYTIQKIKQSGGIRTVRGWRLFDLLSTQRDTGVLKIGLAKLMSAFELNSKEIKYEYYDFKRFVLVPAIADIQQHAKLNLQFEEAKQGRRVASLTFRFKDTEQKKRKAALESPEATPAETTKPKPTDDHDDQSIWHRDNLHKNPLLKQFRKPDESRLEKNEPVEEDEEEDIPFH